MGASGAQIFRLPLADEAATIALGRAMGAQLERGDLIALQGVLGAGKTTLARAIIRARLGEETPVPSPTFTLAQIYQAPDLAICHADLYRLDDQAEIRELGLEEALASGALVLEWPEKMGAELPCNRVHLQLVLQGEAETRLARIWTASTRWQRKLAAWGGHERP